MSKTVCLFFGLVVDFFTDFVCRLFVALPLLGLSQFSLLPNKILFTSQNRSKGPKINHFAALNKLGSKSS